MADRPKTSHLIRIGDSGNMPEIGDNSIDLIVTSPPYPMIQMWDGQFTRMDPKIGADLDEGNGAGAFEGMHQRLDPVWGETLRILKPGGIACINIGDATRSLKGHFQLFANHARIITACLSLGFSQLPTILWRKPTNAPNKFMGSGMLPPGAYVTHEHEYILIFRKGQKRAFGEDQKLKRRESAYFWEERNAWFSDIWFDLRGTAQRVSGGDGDKRSGAFPLELPLRLIQMFSLQGDTVVDPFLGSGTTMIAAMCAARNSVGYDIDQDLRAGILAKLANVPDIANQIMRDRLTAHHAFVRERTRSKGAPKHSNRTYGFPVMTRQEEDLRLLPVHHIQYQSSSKFVLEYGDLHQIDAPALDPIVDTEALQDDALVPKGRQMKLF